MDSVYDYLGAFHCFHSKISPDLCHSCSDLDELTAYNIIANSKTNKLNKLDLMYNDERFLLSKVTDVIG